MLKISNLEVTAEGKKILKGITLNVNPGEIHVVMGPNGAGKTSLAMALMGSPNFQFPISNFQSKIILDGKDITRLKTDERARLGLFLTFQKPVEISGVSVKNLLGLLNKDNLEEKIDSSAKKLKISDDLLQRPLNENFSGGEAKKMEFLQAEIISPKYLILDEVDSGLDVDALSTVTKNIAALLKRKPAPGIIIITHNPRILKFLKPNFIHILIDGKIVKTGGVELIAQIEKRGYVND